jgi:GT2 family glycosyltransferase
VQVVEADGALFWCRGMHLAFETALRRGFDAFLWLNDDTMLAPDALARLLASAAMLEQRGGGPVILVGSTVDAVTGALTYGGERRASRFKPLRIERVQPSTAPQRCDSMTGNIVLIGADAARRVGNIDPVFEHSMGDTDYALRANRLGVPVWVDAGVHGTCSDNAAHGTWCDRSQPLARRWRDMMTRKGLPWRSWLALTRRHAGPLWPVHFVLPYAKVVAQSLLSQNIRHKQGAKAK